MKKLGVKLLLLAICATFIFAAGSKVFASTELMPGAGIILCAGGEGEDRDAIIDDDDNDAGEKLDNEAIIDDDDKGASKEVDKESVIDDDDRNASKEVDKGAVMDDPDDPDKSN